MHRTEYGQWHKFNLDKKHILKQTEKACNIQSPKSEFQFWLPKSLIKEEEDSVELSIPPVFTTRIWNGRYSRTVEAHNLVRILRGMPITR